MTTRYQQAQNLRRGGYTPKDIAYLTGNIVENVYKLLQYHPKSHSRDATCNRRKDIVLDYKNGMSVGEIAAKHGVSTETVHLARKMLGVASNREKSAAKEEACVTVDITLTGLNPELPAVRRLMAISMYAAGVPVKIIESDTGIRKHTLARLMRTYGVPQRRQVKR